MKSDDPLKSLCENQERLAAIRCPVEVTRPAGWAAKEQQLEFARQRFEAGNPLALYDGLTLCRDGELPLPKWLSDGLAAFMQDAMQGKMKGERGRGNSFLGEVRKARISETRAHMVWAIRQVQKDRSKWLGLPHPLIHLFLAGQVLDFGRTEEDAFRIASEALRGTFAQGADSTMCKAYRTMNAEDDPYPTFLAFFETEYAFGLRMDGEAGSRKVPGWVADWVAGRPVKR